MKNLLHRIIKNKKESIKILPLLAFLVPIIIMFSLDPVSFKMLWKGRTFLFFFLWLISLELILDWENLKPVKFERLASVKTSILAIVLLFPTIYVIISNYFGLNGLIENWAIQSGFEWANLMPLSTEYIVFTILFFLIVWMIFREKGLRDFMLAGAFLAAISIIYTIDNIYPWGTFTPFQLLVPTTARLAEFVLSLMGFSTELKFENFGKTGVIPFIIMSVPDEPGKWIKYGISWPCAGVESLLIYSITILLFLKMMGFSWRRKIIIFGVGAAVTYLINIWRIVTIFTIGINYPGVGWPDQVGVFHDFYGPLYSIIWIIIYPLLLLGGKRLLQKIGGCNK